MDNTSDAERNTEDDIGSKVLDYIRRIEKQGVEILVCTTCLEYFDLTDKLAVGRPTTMIKSLRSMLSAEIVSL